MPNENPINDHPEWRYAIGAPAKMVVVDTSNLKAIGSFSGQASNIGLSADSGFTRSNEVSIYLMGDGTIQDSNGNVLK